MESCLDPRFPQGFLHNITFFNLNDKMMEYREAVLNDSGQHNAVSILQELEIALCIFSPCLIPCMKVLELDSQGSGLESVATSVVTFYVVIIFVFLAVVSEHTHFSSKVRIVGCDGASLPASTQVFAWIK